MERALEDFALDVGRLVAEKKLFLSAFRRMGSGAWLQFYDAEKEKVTLFDVVLFSTAEERFEQKEIYHSENLIYVTALNVDSEPLYGRMLFNFEIQNNEERSFYRIYFSEAAVHKKTQAVVRPKGI